ncbi:MBG domain-containing protein, partial [Klebsiella pneumoniae]|uniref:MBG domain-containing protein n=1 Tax=Klebsiella pneumoniae TaxID=573 RepID=UPI003AF687BC
TMKGNYSGTKSLSFKIKAKAIKPTVKLSKTSYTYTGKAVTPAVTVKDSAGNTLKKDTDYTVAYASGRKNAGTYTVKVT